MRKTFLAVAFVAGLLTGCGGAETEEAMDTQAVAQPLDARAACLEACAVQSGRCWQNATTPAAQAWCQTITERCPLKCE
ncbi:hypothetical protein HUA76_09370 [Myxococcus sp. CA056]|uniref:hypothetical protein n=1 Tax=unclassified Myxococcus TaxID=2648731 RepID=UPI00157A4FAD|nr:MULTISPECIES: hypothetical protein [unclassified Myxococcus]NTX10993.1 hypothetical protein [Myxococcus sp. CA056]NTX56699.1 hypothetical protein [Myxococcus sp. CA039A]